MARAPGAMTRRVTDVRREVRWSGGGGQAVVVWVVVAAVVAAVLSSSLVTFGEVTIDRTRAQAVADAAVLAAIDGGVTAATAVASANDGVLVECSIGGDGATMEVEVRVGRSSARARASRAP